MSDQNPAPEATTPNETPSTPEDAGQQTFDRAYVEKLRQEAAANRVKAKQAEERLEETKKEAERAKLDEVERLKAEYADLKQKYEAAQTEARSNYLRAELTGKVTDPKLAMAVATAFMKEDGVVDVDGLLDAHPALRPAQQSARTSINPSNPPGDPRDGSPLTPDDFRGKDPEWVRKNMHRLQKNPSDARTGALSGVRLKY